jgi:hypothetical protein
LRAQSDRDLLELAAKGAGYTVARWNDDALLLVGEQEPWNPLTDHGAALRLAVKLHIEVRYQPPGLIDHWATLVRTPENCFAMELGADEFANTCRAIVRAAAAIGAAA